MTDILRLLAWVFAALWVGVTFSLFLERSQQSSRPLRAATAACAHAFVGLVGLAAGSAALAWAILSGVQWLPEPMNLAALKTRAAVVCGGVLLFYGACKFARRA